MNKKAEEIAGDIIVAMIGNGFFGGKGAQSKQPLDLADVVGQCYQVVYKRVVAASWPSTAGPEDYHVE
ncbi:hypothetical protein AMJ39_05160 [candidate division TA06 bacterium DG_24]|jgi:hypothetical protein|uniref:Uncharacterized protein n=3 Tax=Bacteria division TA06 TaxID=1156500 RepID=A0A0S8JFT4_UNCT6|nr:MAG: hypothetical protein AMJ39_05160 [candidate division TA06 bacterium DG_24]KPK66057.1 MAG: hypothetical protein AMJ82_12095 [candidate division TA06 bacterium SM23_40]KPL07502.1 MAG: hypothetical protein AMJ71_08900 [candidate division TA06 bacterium SM1_40]